MLPPLHCLKRRDALLCAAQLSQEVFSKPCRYFISQHPEVEAKIVRELQALGVCATADGKEPRKLTPADMQKLTYLPCVVKVSNTPADLDICPTPESSSILKLKPR